MVHFAPKPGGIFLGAYNHPAHTRDNRSTTVDTQIAYAFLIGFVLGALFGALASTVFQISAATHHLLNRRHDDKPIPKPLPVDPPESGS